MKGYKGFDYNLQCRGKQYEVGKIHHQDGKIEICKNGIHFCKNLNEVLRYYPDGRYCEIEATGTVIADYDKCVASDIYVIRELDLIEVNRHRYGIGYCYGDGKGYGDGYGNGCGDCYCYGYGNGRGNGNGCSNGNGYGVDHHYYNKNERLGYGNGYGDSYGNGYGNGHGDCIQNILIFMED